MLTACDTEVRDLLVGDFAQGHLIDGRVVCGGDRRPVSRPSDGQRYAEVPFADAQVVDRAVESAGKAFKTSGWATMPPRMRAAILRRWADLVEVKTEPLARLECVGSTRPLEDVRTRDIPTSADCLRFFAEFADKLGGDVAATKSETFGFTVTEPYGVVAAISPWNYPLQMACWKVGPALAAGNAVVLKPSELTPFTAVMLAQLAIEAGVPPGIFNVVHGDGSAGRRLVTNDLVSKVTFTGSNRTGALITAALAETGLKPHTLELGGKSPVVVFEDCYDLEKAAQCVSHGIFNNAGQVCVAASRLLVHKSIADRLVERVIALARLRRPDRTWSPRCSLSPIINESEAQRISRAVDDAIKQGASVLAGGRMLETSGGSFYEPTVLCDVSDTSHIVREEIFGPVLTLQVFTHEQEAFDCANSGRYGLNAAIFTSDLGRALRAVRQLESGTVWVNHYARSADFNLPTGGFKSSGYGKDLGKEVVEQNLRSKSVLIAWDA